jgi:TonB-linked SusC/RagA family outer membrane protein
MRKIYMKQYLLICAFLMLSGISFAQTFSITGKVVDETNQPLPGAIITVKGSQNNGPTDVNGNFRLTGITNGTVTLSVAFIGYQTIDKTITVAGNTAVNFNMVPAEKGLNEVVIIGYGTQTRKDLTGAISTVSAKDFQQGNITSPEDLIAGKVAGVSITSNGGAPGAGSTVRIRQGASLNASNDPLYVIDGIPIGTSTISGVADPLSLINPNDIETFTVLKDAASTAIYGSRASNGVIIITTKKGVKGAPKIDFSSQYSIGKIIKDISVLSADQFRSYIKSYDATNGTNQSALLGTANTNWQNEIYQTAATSDNNISVTGSTKNMPYRVSVGYLDQTGILKTDELKRTTAAISLSPKFFHDDLKVDINVKGSVSNTRFANTGAIGAAISYDPTQPIYDKNSPWNGYHEWYNTPNNPSSGINPNAPHNPLGMLEDDHNTSTAYRSFGNAQFDYRFPFLHELHANLNLGYDIAKGNGNTYVPANAAQAYATPGGGANNPYASSYQNTVSEFYLNYNKDLKSIKSNINATAGYGFYNYLTTNYNYYSYNAAKDTVTGSKPTFAYDKPEHTLISYYARLIYTFNKKYILAGSVRDDASSRFAPANRNAVFPSVAFTWRISDENFLKNSPALSDLKLRVSYGVTGQQEGIANYSYLPTYGLGLSNSLYQFGNTFYNTYSPAAYNANLKWEQTAATNIGVDYGFLNNRITGSIDVYYKNTTNLLETVPVPVGSNFSNFLTINVGDMVSRGVEFSVSAIPVTTKDFNWTVSFNATYQTSTITRLLTSTTPGFVGNQITGISGGTGNTIQIQSVGYNPSAFYVYKQVYGANGKPLEGVYADLNGDGVINQQDLYHDHSAYPPFIYGFSTQFSYKKWTLSTVLRANVGNYMYNNIASANGTQQNLISSGAINNASTDILNTGFVKGQYLSDYYIQNASFLKMDNLGLSYDVGQIFNNKNINLRVHANCQNVFTITKYTGVDPEIYSGVDNNFYPRPRTYTLGLNLGL